MGNKIKNVFRFLIIISEILIGQIVTQYMSFYNNTKYQRYAIWSLFIATALFIIGNIIAIIFYDGYEFFNQFFSELGSRADVMDEDGNMWPKAEYPEIFNISLYITAVFMVPFFVFLPSQFRSLESKIIVPILTAVSGIISSIYLILVGVYDMGLYLDKHIEVALNLYLGIIFTITLFGISLILLPEDDKYRKHYSLRLDMIFIVLTFVITGINYMQEVPDFISIIPRATFQKIMPYTFLPYLTLYGIRNLKLLKN